LGKSGGQGRGRRRGVQFRKTKVCFRPKGKGKSNNGGGGAGGRKIDCSVEKKI